MVSKWWDPLEDWKQGDDVIRLAFRQTGSDHHLDHGMEF